MIVFFVRIIYNLYEQKGQVVILSENINLDNLLKNNNGIIKASEAKIMGINNKELQRQVDYGTLERVAFGLYISAGVFPDEYFITQYRCPKGIFSYETALYFHDLSDRVPLKLTMTIPTGHNTKLLLEKENYQFYYCKKDLHGIGIVTVKTVFGNDVAVYDVERTLCECIKKISVLDRDIVLTALKQYMSESEKDLSKLLKYAELFKVKDIMKQYMEVLI